MEMKETFIAVLKSLVVKQEDVMVEDTVDERGTLFTVFVNKSDMGRIIGKSGQMANSLRVVLRGMGAKDDLRVSMKLHEPGELI